ncbi:hypothetical protein [Agromyces sp. GXQ0307]|uniref:hypothetical protein n=1 Tax=Agromyces sp. GXQ0307 TaxID=3377835 RepID=UPI003839E32A
MSDVAKKGKAFSMDGAPRTVIIWGIAVSVCAALLIVLVPAVADWAAIGATSQGQEARVAIELVVRVLREVAGPIGAALIGAALVMGFIQGRAKMEPR